MRILGLMKCKMCGKVFHYCSSCDSIDYHDLGFCSADCWKSSKEFQDIITEFSTFVDTLNNKGLIYLHKLLTDIEVQYEWYFVDIIINKLKESE